MIQQVQQIWASATLRQIFNPLWIFQTPHKNQAALHLFSIGVKKDQSCPGIIVQQLMLCESKDLFSLWERNQDLSKNQFWASVTLFRFPNLYFVYVVYNLVGQPDKDHWSQVPQPTCGWIGQPDKDNWQWSRNWGIGNGFNSFETQEFLVWHEQLGRGRQ